MEKTYTKATIINTYDDVNDYFLAIDLSTGDEIGRRSTEQYGTWRYDDGYDFDNMVRRVALDLHINEYKLITW